MKYYEYYCLYNVIYCSQSKYFTYFKCVKLFYNKRSICFTVQASAGSAVAFSAFISNTLRLSLHQDVIFDHVITNVGEAYNAQSGHFVAPKPGLYVFYVVLTNTPGHAASANLLHNGRMITELLADDVDNAYLTSTQVAIVQVERGDQVWLQNEHQFSTIEEFDGYLWSSFSGHLIQYN